jgi:hypothetical protein
MKNRKIEKYNVIKRILFLKLLQIQFSDDEIKGFNAELTFSDDFATKIVDNSEKDK